jgi:very-short-patch-repair endonuclease
MATMVREVTQRIIRDRGWLTGSSLEDRVTHLLSGAWVPGSVVQQYRVLSFRLDYAWPEIRLALEVDGWHHRSPQAAAKDADRDAQLRGAGWVVVRIDDRSGEESLLDQVVRVSEIAAALLKGKGVIRSGVTKQWRSST